MNLSKLHCGCLMLQIHPAFCCIIQQALWLSVRR